MAMIDSKRIDKIHKDYEDYQTYQRVAQPRKDTFVAPPFPRRGVHIDPDRRAEEFQIPQPLLRYYLEVAMVSDNPLIVQKLKELLMCVKLTLDGEDRTLEIINKDLSQYNKAKEKYQDDTQRAEARYATDIKHYNLHCMKKAQDLSFYMDDLVEASIRRYEDGVPTVWDKFVCDILAEECLTEPEYTDWEEAFEKFKGFQLSTKVSVIDDLRSKHVCWIEDQLNENADKIYETFKVDERIVELDAEEFLPLFDEDGEVICDNAMDLYYRRVDELEEEYKYEAREEAIRHLQEMYYSGADGYDTIYNYSPCVGR